MESASIDTGLINTSKLRERWKQRERPDWEKRCDELERRLDDLVRLVNIMAGAEHKLTKEMKEKLDELDTAS